ncbi:MAG: hypothetical protein WCY19_02720 [Candidatus Gastranaerophilaceae bacterium]
MVKIFDKTILLLYGLLHSAFGVAYLIWGLYFYINMPPVINNARDWLINSLGTKFMVDQFSSICLLIAGVGYFILGIIMTKKIWKKIILKKA